MEVLIRNEQQSDYRAVEEITRTAFWNLHYPGCNEHYLAHTMRDHVDFVRELDLVIEVDGQIIGNIMYTKTQIVNTKGNVKNILSFGPISILPEYQRKGYGKKLMEYSFDRAKALGYEMVVIFGNPSNYVGVGFKSSRKFNISVGEGIYPSALLVKELKNIDIDINDEWIYKESDICDIDQSKSDAFDLEFELLKKEEKPSQEEFFILSNSLIRSNRISYIIN